METQMTEFIMCLHLMAATEPDFAGCKTEAHPNLTHVSAWTADAAGN